MLGSIQFDAAFDSCHDTSNRSCAHLCDEQVFRIFSILWPRNEKKRMGSVVVLTFRPPRISGLDATMTDDNISKVLLLASLFRVESKIRSTSAIRSSRRRLHLLALRRPDRSKVCVMYAFAYSYCRVSILRFVVEMTPALLVSPRGRRQAFKVVCDAPLSSLRRCSVTQAHSGYP
jgi:hypothetical protein